VRSSDRIWRDNNLGGGLGRYFPLNAARVRSRSGGREPDRRDGRSGLPSPGVQARYNNCEAPPALLGDAMRGRAGDGMDRVQLLDPHKFAEIDHLDGPGESAAPIGAVNCVMRRREKPIGENTEGRGFVTALRSFVDPSGNTVVLFGAGGAAHAVAVELALAGASRIVVGNRSRPAQSRWLRF
jgi:shikimate 5-dehydrogenase